VIDRVSRGDYEAITSGNARPVIIRLRAMQVDALSRGDYDEADNLELFIGRANHVYTTHAAEQLNSAQKEDLNNQLCVARQELAYFQAHWRTVFRNASQRRVDDLGELQRQNEEDLAAFDEEVATSETPVRFRRFSMELLQLRRRQKAMVASKRYIEAKAIKDEADRREAKENVENHERYLAKAAADRAEMIKKQDERLYVRDQNWIRSLHEIQNIGSVEVEQIKRTIAHLESRIDDKDEFARTAGWTEDNCPRAQSARNRAPGDALTPHAQMYRQRRIINQVAYSHVIVPKRKTPKTTR
jgi:hypothetical protein